MKTAAEILTEQHLAVLPLAEKIEKAAYTAERADELIAIYGGNNTLGNLAYYAAQRVMAGELRLGWVK